MLKIINNIEINYEKEAENYIEDVIDYLILEIPEMYNFFKIIKIEKIKLKIIPTKAELDKIYENYFESEAPEWVVGFGINEHEIIMLSFNEYKNTIHKYETLEDYKKTVIHELVHEVHLQFCESAYKLPIPIWEGLAVYLSKQYNGIEGRLTATKEELLNQTCDFKEFYFFFKELIKIYDEKALLEILANKMDSSKIVDEIISNI